jgi:hypothetical protein
VVPGTDARFVLMSIERANQRPLRIVRWYLKALFVVVGAFLVYLIAAIPFGPGGAGIARSILTVLLVILGTRLFRGADEDVAPGRPWWRMTGGVPSGIVLGALCALVALGSAVGFVGLTLSTLAPKDTVDLPDLLINTVLAAVLAYLYFDSARRLAVLRRDAAIAAERANRKP